LQPQDGSTYLGLVARANGTWESVGQMLVVPLHAGACYSLTVMMAQSDNNKSRITVTAKKGATTVENNFPPARILIWGGLKECERLELLAESIDVTNHAWKAYELILSPHDDYSHIMIEVYYSKSKKEHYNGHVLIDNLSPIIAIDCK